ncbi:MAG: flagellar motor switch protein FliN [Candidatus Margulisiibacteriota bacterium]
MGENESHEVDRIRFTELDNSAVGPKIDKKLLADIPIEATVELGRTKLTLREIMELAEGSIISLDKFAGEPLEVKVGGQTVAIGEVIAVDDCYGIRIAEVKIK